MGNQKPKYQSVLLTIPVANYLVDTPFVAKISPDKAYDTLDGVAVHVVNDSGAANGYYRLAMRNDNGDIHDPTHIAGWATGKADGTNPNEKYKDVFVDLRGGGDIVFTAILPAQNLATAVLIDINIRIRQTQVRTA